MSEFLLAQLSTREVEFIAQNELVKVFPTTTLGTLHLISVAMASPLAHSSQHYPSAGRLWALADKPGEQRAAVAGAPTEKVATVPHRPAAVDGSGVAGAAGAGGGGEAGRLYPAALSLSGDCHGHPRVVRRRAQHRLLILHSAADDVTAAEQVRILIQKLREQRMAKIRLGLPLLDGNPLKVRSLPQAPI